MFKEFKILNNLVKGNIIEQPLLHDGFIKISIGANRLEKNWQKLDIPWQDFLKRLQQTTYTKETQEEYLSLPKEKQDKIKDVGGFVGGVLRGGRRQAQSIINRQLITLDADFAPLDLWDKFTSLYKNAAVIYSTHKHSQDTPRFRLIIPLQSPIGADAYIAISRYIANSIGMDYFDETTFQPERLMFWPSTSKNAEYYFKYQDAQWLEPDYILSKYENWRDSSLWPGASKDVSFTADKIKKLGDPMTKPGLIGAFCRAYSIHEAIEKFLSNTYTPCSITGRYTYTKGSTAGGLITYEDKYAYSHHATDPASMRLCNAFDLVRMHKFSNLDQKVRPETPINRRPSYHAMINLAQNCINAKAEPTENSLDFKTTNAITNKYKNHKTPKNAHGVENHKEQGSDWMNQLEVDAKGRYLSSNKNIRLIVDKDPKLSKAFAFDQFKKLALVVKQLPWRHIQTLPTSLEDVDDAGLRVYLDMHYGIQGPLKIKDALELAIRKNAFHPIKDYLNGLNWDNVPRLDTLFIDYLGAEDCSYTRAVTQKSIVAAVARIFNPGIKFDNVLVLVGKQGVGKSTIISKLGGKWYSDSFFNIHGTKAFEQLQGVWLMEIGELAALRKAEMENIKLFISKQEDIYRPAYGRKVEAFPRQCVFFGTTNNEDFLRDPTGNRRFWPVQVHERSNKSIFKDLTKSIIDQIWAEAVTLFKQGKKLFLEEEALRQQAKDKQTEHSQVDERTGIIEQYLDTLLPDNWESMDLFSRRNFLQDASLTKPGTVKRMRVCVAEIWCELLGKQQGEMTFYNTKDLHNIMRNMEGWESYKQNKVHARFKIYGRQKYYVRKQ